MKPTAIFGLLAALAAAPAHASDCSGFQKARDQLYTVLGGPIMPELQAKGVQSRERLNMAMMALSVQYREALAAGDAESSLKMIGLRVFLLPFTGEAVDAAAKKLQCDLVGASNAASKIMLHPLACAAMTLDGTGKDSADARKEALAMLDMAQARLAGDPNGEGAKTLLDGTAPQLRACAAD